MGKYSELAYKVTHLIGEGRSMRILNFGSLNIDYTYILTHIVKPGETISSKSLQVFPGGKGLNQSIALARAGSEVYHAGCIGEDGKFLEQLCRDNGVHTEFIKTDKVRTGNAIIQVADDGQNSIILYPGSNRNIQTEDVDRVLENFGEGDILLLQNEINQMPYIMEKADRKGMKICLNPSPYDAYIEECPLENVHMFLMNEVEGFQMTGKKDEEEILETMGEKYPGAEVVLTLGEKGACYKNGRETFYTPAFKVKAIDTTAAGDTFTGFFIHAILEGQSGDQALQNAAAASAIAVSRKGASSSIPVWEEVQTFLKDHSAGKQV